MLIFNIRRCIGVLHCRAGANTTDLAFLHAASGGWKEAVKFFLEEMGVKIQTNNDAKVRQLPRRIQNFAPLTSTVMRI
jgi:hypothetical protein